MATRALPVPSKSRHSRQSHTGLALLEALSTEYRAALRRSERYRGRVATCRAGGVDSDPLVCRHPRCQLALPRGLAGFAPFGFVLEVLVREEQLLTSSPYDTQRRNRHSAAACLGAPYYVLACASLFELTTLPLASALARKRLLGATLVSRFQVVGMLPDILDDVFLLNLPLEAAERALDRFAVLDPDLSQV